MYRRIRNTARFLLGNLKGFSTSYPVKIDDMPSLERWVMHRLNEVIRKAGDGFENYEYHLPTYAIHSFCVNDLSAFYLDVRKDRLYAEYKHSFERCAAQSAMWEVLTALAKMLAPILSFTAEEIWQKAREIDHSLPESVFLTNFPKPIPFGGEDIEVAIWDKVVLPLRGAVSRVLEKLRADKIIGTSLEASVHVKTPSPDATNLRVSYPKLRLSDPPGTTYPLSEFLTPEELADVMIVSQFEWTDDSSKYAHLRYHHDEETGYEIAATMAQGIKCPRCWKYVVPSPDSEVPPFTDGLCPRCQHVLIIS
jgi:isoleucyl-tRNA synthetase